MNEELKKRTINKMTKSPKNLINGPLTIGFDISETKDHCCLIVGQIMKKDEIMIVNEFYDEEANNMFKLLIGGNNHEEGN